MSATDNRPVALIATMNQAKIREHRALFADLPIRWVTPSDVGTAPEVVETGTTFVDNALLKARAYARWSGLPALADDGGLAIDLLGGEPGVTSRRWIGGRDASDDELIQYTLERMRGVPRERRGAAMVIAVAFVLPPSEGASTWLDRGPAETIGTGEIRGYIAETAAERRDPGFPFRAVFKVERFDKYYLDLTEEEHELVNHRRAAAQAIRARLTPPVGA